MKDDPRDRLPTHSSMLEDTGKWTAWAASRLMMLSRHQQNHQLLNPMLRRSAAKAAFELTAGESGLAWRTVGADQFTSADTPQFPYHTHFSSSLSD